MRLKLGLSHKYCPPPPNTFVNNIAITGSPGPHLAAKSCPLCQKWSPIQMDCQMFSKHFPTPSFMQACLYLHATALHACMYNTKL